MATREEILRLQHEREVAKAEQAQKKAKQIERLLAGEQRKRENRRKYIAGGYLLKALLTDKSPCRSYEELLHILDKTLTKNIDRRAFDLPELAQTPKQRRRGTVDRTAEKTQPKTRTSLPSSLIVATLPDDVMVANEDQPTAAKKTKALQEPSQEALLEDFNV